MALYATGGITLKSLDAAKTHVKPEVGTKNTKKVGLKLPALIPPISPSEIANKTSRQSKFCAKGWEVPTQSMVKLAAKKIDDADMLVIVSLARELSRASRHNAREADSDFDPDDSILQLGNGSAHSSDEDVPSHNFLGDEDGDDNSTESEG